MKIVSGLGSICLAFHSKSGCVAKWLRHSFLKLVGSTSVGLNHVVRTTNHKPSAYSAVHPSKKVRKFEGSSAGKADVPQGFTSCTATRNIACITVTWLVTCAQSFMADKEPYV